MAKTVANILEALIWIQDTSFDVLAEKSKAFHMSNKERLRDPFLPFPCELVWWMRFTHRSRILDTDMPLDKTHMNQYEMNRYNLFLTNFGRNDLLIY